MKKCKIAIILASILATVSLLGGDVKAADNKKVDMIFTHDLHSYLEEYVVNDDGAKKTVGGFARLKTLIDEKKNGNPDTLVVDAGDIAMGTLYHIVYENEALEMRLLGELGFDATTIGNHEFDFGTQALANMFRSAKAKASRVPAYSICNIDWTVEDEATKTIKSALDEFGYYDYYVTEKDGVKIAIFGVLGNVAYSDAPRCELTVMDPIASSKTTVEKIKANEDVDMIVCLSHSGTNDDVKQSEDEQLAMAVPDIDVIVSGHTHTVLPEPIVYGDTYIVGCGSYGRYTGTCSLIPDDHGRWDMEEYALIEMDESIPQDEGILSELREYKRAIDEDYMQGYGYTCNQVITTNPYVEFETVESLEDDHTEKALGSIIADSYKYAVSQTAAGKKVPVDFAVAPAGTIRGTYTKGDISIQQVFESFSLGTGADGTVGYPLLEFYIKGEEIKTLVEVDASISDLMHSARLYTSGINMSYNPHRIILNKANDVWFNSELLGEERIELDENRLYHVVCDLYSAEMLATVNSMSKGILTLVVRDENGDPVTDYSTRIVYTDEGKELKAWIAIAEYFDSFGGEIPAYYGEMHNRKVVEDTFSPISMFKNLNKFFFIIIGLVIVLLVLVILIVRLIVRIIKKIVKKSRNSTKKE